MLDHVAGLLSSVLPEGHYEHLYQEFAQVSGHISAAVGAQSELIATAQVEDPKSDTLSMPVRKHKAVYDKYAALRSQTPLRGEAADVDDYWTDLLFGREDEKPTSTAFQAKA